jgi:DNA polymerase-3 subunit beta
MNLIKTSREALLKPLQAVSGIIERRHTLPILSNVLLSRKGGTLAFVATDIEIEVSADMPCEGEEKAVTVGARKLLDILRALPDQADVVLSLAEKRLQVKAGKSRFNLQTLAPEDFPRMSAGDATTKFSISQKILKRLVGLVLYSMAQQDIRYYLNGLLLVIDEEGLKVVATDGHRLAYASSAQAGASKSKQEVILPRKTVLELARLLEDGDASVEVEIGTGQARFSFNGVVIQSKLVDGKFPDYTRVIPKNHPKQIKLNRTVLQDALQRAAILTSDKFKGVRWILSDGSLKISCSNNEQEEAQEELDVDYKGEALDIGFNVQYLLDVLNNLDVSDIECALGDANSSALITEPGKDDFKYVVMPMRI